MSEKEILWAVPFNAFELFREKQVPFRALAEELELEHGELRQYALRTLCPLPLFEALIAILDPGNVAKWLDRRYAVRSKDFPPMPDTVRLVAAKFEALAAGQTLPTNVAGVGIRFEPPTAARLAAAERTVAGMDLTLNNQHELVRLRAETSTHMAAADKLLSRRESTLVRPPAPTPVGDGPLDVVPRITSEAVKAFRDTSGWSQQQLANALGVSLATVSRWEHGHATPRRAKRKRLHRLFQQVPVGAAPPALPPAVVTPSAAAPAPDQQVSEVLLALLVRVQNARDDALRRVEQLEHKLDGMSAVEAKAAQLAEENRGLLARVAKLVAESEVYEKLLERAETPTPPVPAAAAKAAETLLERRAPKLLEDLEKLPKTSGYAA